MSVEYNMSKKDRDDIFTKLDNIADKQNRIHESVSLIKKELEFVHNDICDNKKKADNLESKFYLFKENINKQVQENKTQLAVIAGGVSLIAVIIAEVVSRFI